MKAKSGLLLLSDGNEKGNGIQLRKVKSEASKEGNVSPNGNLRNSSAEKAKSENFKNSDVIEANKVIVVADVLDESKKFKEYYLLVKAKSENFKNSDVSEANKVVVVDDVLDESSKGNKAENEKKGNESFEENKIVIVEENKVHVSNNEQKQVPISPIIKKQSPPISGQSRIHHHHPSPSRTKPVPTSDESQRNIPRQHSKLESFVDLVMWRDASKSTLIFGIGTFFIISSSYTQDLNISLISVISYLSLVYLATIFLFKSQGCKMIGESSEYIVGEEEAVWILKLILPYINECLLKIRALFSGDPATTMKVDKNFASLQMAIVLFILARCGSSITIWKMTNWVFLEFSRIKSLFFLFHTVNCLWYILIRRFRDAWGTCTHKKAVAFAHSLSYGIYLQFLLEFGFYVVCRI
ncbi:hypothetical protein HAX54_011732 [Datura stramonium]|uniref:Reticulon domain-containing protein n=1 Tax=Datura stramonium TaxID=4076 RepID=A0ABS8RXW1_DATST|nr:hypothetical protein [Datura stramonium]